MLPLIVALVTAIASAAAMPPATAQAAPQDPCAPAYGSFGAGNWPPACWRPYSDASPFNVRVPPNPTLNPRSAQIVQRLVGFGPPNPERAGHADGGNDFDKPVYFAQDGDPVVTLNGSGNSPIDGERIHVPAGARPASGGDAHMTIVQSNGWEYDLYQAHEPSGGVLSYSSGRKIRIDGDGLNSAATASRFGNLAGKVREPELRAGVINHALVMAINCTSGTFVWPAMKTDSRCSNPTDAPPMGAHFWLAMSDGQINALPVPAWKKTILTAAAHYGAFVGDSTGSPWSLLGFWSGTTYTSFGVADPMVAFAQSVGIKSNGGIYYFPIDGGVDWARYLRVLDPSVARNGAPSSASALRLWAVSVKPRRFRATGGRASAARRARRGARLRFRVSKAATVTVVVLRANRGRKAGGRCRKQTRANRRGRPCTRWGGVGNLSFNGKKGLNRPRFSGRLNRKRLRVGRYRLVAVASDANGARSRTKRTAFRIVRR
jgi:hypothetical protein